MFGLLPLRLEQQVGRGLGNDMSAVLKALDSLGLRGILERRHTHTRTHTRTSVAVLRLGGYN